MIETNLSLNVHEVGVILSALQSLSVSDERYISRECGSVSALYNKVYTVWEQMDRSSIEQSYETIIEPSF